jgi:hypothetical protein
MATIKVTIYDDFGHEIGLQEKIMKSTLHDFDAIEEDSDRRCGRTISTRSHARNN